MTGYNLIQNKSIVLSYWGWILGYYHTMFYG